MALQKYLNFKTNVILVWLYYQLDCSLAPTCQQAKPNKTPIRLDAAMSTTGFVNFLFLLLSWGPYN